MFTKNLNNAMSFIIMNTGLLFNESKLLNELKEKQNLSMTKSEVWLPMRSSGELEGGVGNIGGDVNILLCLVTQSCPTLCDATVHQAPLSMGILRARILEWVDMPSSRGSSQPGD